MTENSLKALENLRKTDNMQWYIVPLLIFVIYVYVVEIERQNWHLVLIGFITIFLELIWEMFNALILHFSRYAPLWICPGRSAYLIYVGFNIEIASFFAVAPFLLIKSLPKDKSKKTFGLSNRYVIPVIWGLICIFVELILNKAGLLIWEYYWWSWPNLYLIFIAYSLPWFFIAWAYDNTSLKTKKITAICSFFAAIICHLLFVNILKWI